MKSIVLVMAALFLFVGCATAQSTYTGPTEPNLNMPSSSPSAAATTSYQPGLASHPTYRVKDQPPQGQRTERTFFSVNGGFTKVDAEAYRVGGMKVGFWGNPGVQLSPQKPPAIQKWMCGNMKVYTVIFSCKEQAEQFLASSNRDALVAKWRSALDSTQPIPDASRPGAFQVYLPLS